MTDIPAEVDLLVLGSGAGGMTAALAGAVMGLDVLLVEKTDQVGGTSATSAGSIWAPNSRHSPKDTDSFENALTYLRNAVGNRLNEERAAAFLRAAPEMVDWLEDHTDVNLRAYPHHPDYLATLEGATLAGRVLEPEPFDASVLGPRFADLRSPLPEFMLFGGLMVDRTDIGHLMKGIRSISSLGHTASLLARYARDRLLHHRGTRLVMGNALVGRLYQSLLQRGVPVLLSTEVLSITQSENRVTGAVLRRAGETIRVRGRAGVVLATGGISHHPELRKRLMPTALGNTSPVIDSATGDGLTLAEQLGGHLASEHDSNSFWAPVSRRQRQDGSTAVFPHFVLDRGKPGALAVNAEGHRFVSEATTYHLFGEALFAAKQASGSACYLICDDTFIAKYGLGMVRPKRMNLRAAIAEGYVTRAGTLNELAGKLAIPPGALADTVARHNGFARTGKDTDFSKGEDAYQRNLGDPAHGPNPCIGEMARPPFYAVEIHPGDIGASAGLACDASARVLGADGVPIEGLYACGNDMESIMAGHYPGPGITLGPAMTFGFIAARHAAETGGTP